MPRSTLMKIGLFAALGTGIVCLVYGLLWDFIPFNKYQGMFWLTFMPLILFFMKEHQERKFLLNMLLTFCCGLLWGLLAVGAIMVLNPAGTIVLDIVIDFIICGLIVFVHKGLLDATPFNAVACAFLGFAEALGCLQTSFPISGELVAPMTLGAPDLLILFVCGLACTFALSWLCDLLIGKFVFKGQPPLPPEQADAPDKQ